MVTKKKTVKKETEAPKHGFDKQPNDNGEIVIDAIGGDQNISEPQIPEKMKMLSSKDPYSGEPPKKKSTKDSASQDRE